MGILTKFREFTAFGTAKIVSSVITGLFWMYIASLIGTEDYGEISYIIAIAGISSTIASLGTPITITVYSAKGVKIQPSLSFIIISSAVISAIILFIIFMQIELSVLVLGSTIFPLVLNELLGRKLYQTYAKQILLQKILMIVFSLSLYHVFGIEGLILGYGLSFFPFTIKAFREARKFDFNFGIIKERKSFMINSYFTDLARIFSFSTDKLIIAPLYGFSVLGNYQLGVQVLTLAIILPDIVFHYILPQEAQGSSNKKLKYLTIIFSVGISGMLYALAPMLIPIFFEKFNDSIPVIQILAFAIIPRTISFLLMSKFFGQEKSQIVIYASIIYLIIQIIGIIVLGETYAIYGIALSLVFASVGEMIFYIVKNGIKFEKNSNIDQN